MTLTTTTNKVAYAGNGSTTSFAVTFIYWDDTDVRVILTNDTTGVETVWTDGTQYNITGGSGTTGTLTIDISPTDYTPATGETLTIKSNLPDTQSTSLPLGGSLPSTSIEERFDKNVRLSQQLAEELTRAIQFSETSPATSTFITETAAQRANKLLAFNASGNLTVTQEVGTYVGNWATSTAYVARDIIKDTSNNNIYLCITGHTSSGAQPISSNTDVAKWALLVDAASATTSAATATTQAGIATTQAGIATTQAGIATTQAGIATAKAVLTASDAVDTAADLVLTNADVVLAEAAQVSAVGAVGAVAWKYTFSTTTTMADPTTGQIRFDNGTLASVTNIAIDATSADTGNPDVSDLIASIDDGTNSTHEGYIFVRKHGTPATFMAYNVTSAIVDNTGWLQIPVTHAASGGTLSNADTLYISFSRSGNVGATGTAATVAVNSVTGNTVSVGGSATAAVVNSGSSSSASLDFTFGIPTGATGATGAAGDATLADIIALG
tara:strand:+ start:44882 stop:46375 length:1494 start_codon:yes stop_codon:yes gene_type:complete